MKIKSNNRTKWVHLRLSLAEHKLLMNRKSNTTARSLSQYLRELIFERPVIATYRNLSQDDAIGRLAVLNHELNSLGNNLNQVTRKLHTLRHEEKYSWGLQFSEQADTILLKINEVKETIQRIAERWLR